MSRLLQKRWIKRLILRWAILENGLLMTFQQSSSTFIMDQFMKYIYICDMKGWKLILLPLLILKVLSSFLPVL